MNHRKIIEVKNAGAFDVSVTQTSTDRFTVQYGLQVVRSLNYAQAAHEFGECLFHALACDGRFDPHEAAETLTLVSKVQ